MRPLWSFCLTSEQKNAIFAQIWSKKRGAAITEDWDNESYQVKAWSPLSLPQVQIISWQSSRNGPPSSSCGTCNGEKWGKYEVFAVAVDEDCYWQNQRMVSSKACSSPALHEVQRIHWEHFQNIPPFSSSRRSKLTENAISTHFRAVVAVDGYIGRAWYQKLSIEGTIVSINTPSAIDHVVEPPKYLLIVFVPALGRWKNGGSAFFTVAVDGDCGRLNEAKCTYECCSSPPLHDVQRIQWHHHQKTTPSCSFRTAKLVGNAIFALIWLF